MFKKILLSIILLASCIFFTADFALAQTKPEVGITYAENIGLEGGGLDVRVVLARIVQVALGFLSLIAVIYVMYAGWLWMTSEGSEEKISKAKKTLINAVIGLIVMLSAFMIVTWIINNLGLNNSPSPGQGSGRPSYNGGIGVLGACSVENVYPEPNQEDVPRNTAIFVTFKEEVDPATICKDAVADGGNGNHICDVGEYVIPENVRLFKQTAGDGCPGSCANNVVEMNVYSNDNKTFVFAPVNYIGSPSEYLWYEMYLSNDILKTNGDGVFDNCRTDFMDWAFHVSDKIDLTPPQVKNSGVFPAPDDASDTYSGTAAVNSTGIISFSGNPEAGSDAYIVNPGAVVANGGSPAVVSGSVVIDPECQESGALLVSLPMTSDGKTAELSIGSTLLGSAVFSGKSITFPGYLSFAVNDFPEAGNSWSFPGIVAQVNSDILQVGNIRYKFVSTVTGANQILVATLLSGTINNAVTVINNNSQVSAVAGAGNTIDTTASVAGINGNSIIFTTTSANLSLAPNIGHLSGGSDSEEIVTVNDRKDKPRNAVIQINFNEAILPLTISGKADDVSDYIRVVNNSTGALPDTAACTDNNDCLSFKCSTGGTCVNSYLAGKFVVSNIYKTVEFVSNNLCGVNGCGEEIYCLPPDSNVRVEIEAATLDGANNCSARSPFSNVGAQHCEDDSGNFYPLSDLTLMDGVMDAAMNSLDGDRSTFAEGKSVALINYYNENTSAGDGDSFKWSFFVSDKLDLVPPLINNTTPAINGTGVGLNDNISLDFDKVMMCSSIRTGQKKITSGSNTVIHHNLNAWSSGGAGFGYWTTCMGVDDGPVDGEYDWTAAGLKHTAFPDTSSLRSQAGSGLRDIYQNCYKPSGDNIGCVASDTNPSCCDGTVTGALGSDGNCP